MKLAYTALWDATDIRSWSGTDRNIWESLRSAGAEISLVDQLAHGPSPARKLRKLWSLYVERKEFTHIWDVDTARGYARDAATRISGLNADAIISPSPIPLAYLQRKEPVFLWTDAPFAALVDFYPEFHRNRMSTTSINSGLIVDKAALDRCQIAIFSSEWAAQRAVQLHCIDAKKVKVVPFGANIDISHDAQSVEAFLERRSVGPFRLLWLGVDWERKGGDTALQAARLMHERGIQVELNMVGCDPPAGKTIPEYVRCQGFVSKTTAEGTETIKKLLRDANVLVLPTIAEAYGVAFVEAHAFGVPCAATAVGGIPTIVEDGATGRLFDPREPVEVWADWLCELATDPYLYRRFALAAFDRYVTQLNWGVSGAKVMQIIKDSITT